MFEKIYMGTISCLVCIALVVLTLGYGLIGEYVFIHFLPIVVIVLAIVSSTIAAFTDLAFGSFFKYLSKLVNKNAN